MVNWDPVLRAYVPVPKIPDIHNRVRFESVESLRNDFPKEQLTVRNKMGRFPIHTAFFYERYDVVQLLLEKQADPFEEDSEGYSSLHYCARNEKCKDQLRYILNNSDQYRLTVAINGTCSDGLSPLYMACEENLIVIADILLVGIVRNGRTIKAEVNKKNGKRRLTALHIASAKNYHELVKLLLAHNASTSVTSAQGFNAPFLACQFKSILSFEALMEKHESDVNERFSNHKWTLLHAVAEVGLTEAIPILLKKGGDVNLPTEDGFTPLFIACTNFNFSTARALIKLGNANVNQENGPNKTTALHISKAGYPRRFVRLLLQNGAKTECKSIDGLTPLLLACHLGNYNVAKALIEGVVVGGKKVCADINFKFEGKTILKIAKELGSGKIVDLLVSQGAKEY